MTESIWIFPLVVAATLVVSGLLLQSLWIFVQALFSDKVLAKALPQKTSLRIAALIPAHNEEAGLGATLENVKVQLDADDILLVVADNCDDRTAEIARSFGAKVVERQDSDRRGKGYALAAGLHAIKQIEPEIEAVLIVDADCFLGERTIAELKAFSRSNGRPAQADYRMVDDVSSLRNGSELSGRMSLREFAWQFKNSIRASGSMSLACPCQLMGSGMLIPIKMLDAVKLGSSALAEDSLLGLHLVGQAAYPQFVPSAIVLSQFPEAGHASDTQTTRWIHGQLQNLSYLPGLFWAGLTQRDFKKLLFCLDSMVLPMTGLLAGNLLVLLIGAILLVKIGGVVFLTGLISFSLQICALAFASHKLQAKVFSPDKLRHLVRFAFLRLKSVLQFIFAREKQWIRTKR